MRILLLRVRPGKLVLVVGVEISPLGVDILMDRDVKEADILREVVILRRRECGLWNMLPHKEFTSTSIRLRCTSRNIDHCR
jgi:hypothetical protein